VTNAAVTAQTSAERVEAAVAARELAEKQLEAEQSKFEVGMSTNFNVIQAQRDLAVARNSELLAQLDYQIAMINFETVQRVASTGGLGVTQTSTIGSGLNVSTTTPSTTTTGGSGGPGGDNH